MKGKAQRQYHLAHKEDTKTQSKKSDQHVRVARDM